MSTVRPFVARVVNPESARRVVTAMSEPADPETGPVQVPIDSSAYDLSPAAVYVYRQQRDGVAHTGLVCEVAVRAFAEGRVRGHEAVHPRRVEALIRHHARATAPPALVSLIHHAGPAFTENLDATSRTPPILDFDGPCGLRQTVWRVAEGPVTAAVTEELAATEHYIADGHHRVAAALEEWRRADAPAGAGLLCVVHPMAGLRLSAFHRRVTGPVDPEALMRLLVAAFQVRAVPGPPTPTLGAFGLYLAGRWYQVARRREGCDHTADLDVVVLQGQVLDRLRALAPERSPAVDVASARTSVDELTRRCDIDAGALFTLAPPPLATLTRLADAGEVMPPKTTYFEPKPCAGIFLWP